MAQSKKKAIVKADKTTSKPTVKKSVSKNLASKNKFEGEVNGKVFEDEILVDADFSGATLIDCSFPNIKQALHCNFSGTKFVKSVASEDVDGKTVSTYIDSNPFEKMVVTKEMQGDGDDAKEIETKTVFKAEIINCDVTGTDLECQRIPFA